MKKTIFLLLFCVCFSVNSHAQVLEVIKLITSKVIRAIDLKVQQLQNETINLTVLQKKLENRFSETNLAQIAGWEQKQKELYASYFDELTKVKNAIAFTSRVAAIVGRQKQIVSDTRKAIQQLNADSHFSAIEISRFASLFEKLFDQSAANLSFMLQTITAGQLTMNDAERFERLLLMADRVEEQETKLRSLMQQLRDLALSRERNLNEILNIKKIYGFH